MSQSVYSWNLPLNLRNLYHVSSCNSWTGSVNSNPLNLSVTLSLQWIPPILLLHLVRVLHFLWLEPLTTPKSFPDTPCQDGCLINVAFWLQKPAGWINIICSVPPTPNDIIILSHADTKHNMTFLLQSKMYEDGLRQFCLEKPCAMLMTDFFTSDDVSSPRHWVFPIIYAIPASLAPSSSSNSFNTSHATKSYSLASSLWPSPRPILKSRIPC